MFVRGLHLYILFLKVMYADIKVSTLSRTTGDESTKSNKVGHIIISINSLCNRLHRMTRLKYSTRKFKHKLKHYKNCKENIRITIID